MSTDTEKKTSTMRIYMKSGNVICLPNVLSFSYTGGEYRRTLELEQTQKAGTESLMIQSIDLTQIEAITWDDPNV